MILTNLYIFMGVAAALGAIEASYNVGRLGHRLYSEPHLRNDERIHDNSTVLWVAGLLGAYALFAGGVGAVLGGWQMIYEVFSPDVQPFEPGTPAYFWTLLFRLSVATASAVTMVIMWRYFQSRSWRYVGKATAGRFVIYTGVTAAGLL